MGFGSDLGKFRQKTARKAELVTRKIIFDVGTSLVFKSPVGDASYWKMPPPPGYVGGRFRANWQYGVSEINFAVTDKVDPAGAISLAAIGAVLRGGEAAGKVHFLTNSLPYGPRLEEGHSRQAPFGFRRLTVLEFEPVVTAAARAFN
jgi:hypothetical protein